ncbi:flagellar hook-associated protein 3 FlgL [Pseudomonas duriflava]|uniref:Flagellar hook-associated protein 3 FlgL n=1 Tax=Pseudomonas duriflava TaxID=459528 RepID=A0A562Q9Y5_9PSED|nr:flagellar hook-associated protein FlgL [Pseudomonas duriflava]TWI53572.1 flagellar hook-associated protein 3 FlgL [Pseudomonas duriflava]
MRISSLQAYNSGVSGIQRTYSNAARTQEEISNGKKILTPADDPVAAVRLLQLDQEQAALKQYSDNLTAAKNSLTQEESVLDSIGNVVDRVRELTVQAGNGALSKTDRQAIASELKEREEELLGLMNTKNARGEYLFGGFQGKTQPYVRNTDGSYAYVGDEGQRSVQIAGSTKIAITDNGKNIFDNVSNAARLQTSSQSVSGSTLSIGKAIVTDEVSYGTFLQNNPSGAVEIVFDTAEQDVFRVYAYPSDASSTPIYEGRMDEDPQGGDQVVFGGMSFYLDGQAAATPKAVGERFTVMPTRQAVNVQSSSTALDGIVVEDLGAWQSATGGAAAALSVSNVTGNSFDMTLSPSGEVQTVSGSFPQVVSAFGLKMRFDAVPADGASYDLSGQASTEKQSILTSIASLRKVLEDAPDAPQGNIAVRDSVASALTNLASGQDSILKARGQIGGRLNVIEATETSNEDLGLINKTVRSGLEDLDYAEALSRLSLQSVVLEAAQQSYVKISSLSLFSKM